MIRYTHFKFCPKCGKRDIAAVDNKSALCNACGFLYFHNCSASVAGIVQTPRGIILTKRNFSPKKGRLDLPGGFTDYNESLEDALLRELKEELDIRVKIIAYLGSFPNVYLYKTVTYFTIDTVFVCKAASVESLRMSTEIADVIFVTPPAIPFDRIGFASTKQALRRYLKKKRKKHRSPYL
jgi:NADH pyrophosphatase NudC (nudix superfamily)